MSNIIGKSIYEFEPGDIIMRICPIVNSYRNPSIDNNFRQPCKLLGIKNGIIYLEPIEPITILDKPLIYKAYLEIYGNSGWDYYEDVNINNDAPLFPKISLN
jgi:AAA+ ATPase superfamily predicted ATPase